MCSSQLSVVFQYIFNLSLPPESLSAVDDILPGPSAQDEPSECAEQLMAHCTDLALYEGHGEDTPGTVQTTGVPIPGPSAVCLPASCQCK